LSQLSQPGKTSKPHSTNSPDNNLPGLFISRLLKKYNFVIANGVKQSLFEIAKSALSLVLRLLQDFVLRNDNKERTSPNTCFSG